MLIECVLDPEDDAVLPNRHMKFNGNSIGSRMKVLTDRRRLKGALVVITDHDMGLFG